MTGVRVLLTALEPLPGGDWIETVTSLLPEATAERRSIRIPGKRRRQDEIEYSDDVVLGRTWLASRRWAVSALHQRSYYDERGHRIRKPEREILAGRRPRGPKPADAIEERTKILTEIATRLGGSHELVPVELIEIAPSAVKVGEHVVGGGSFNDAYKRVGFHNVPGGWLVSICPTDGVQWTFVEGLAGRLGRAAAARRADLRIQIVDLARIQDRLNEMESDAATHAGRTVLFVLPDRRLEPSGQVRKVLETMDQKGVRYRRSYATDNLDFSVADQLPSLLMASGGTPHVVSLPGRDVWSVGVDLSHDRHTRTTRIALALVDPQGRLVGSWLARQPLDETVRVESVRPMLHRCAAELRSAARGPVPVLVVRDGRAFRDEFAEATLEELGRKNVTLVEYRKGRNPAAFAPGVPPAPVPGPYAVQVPEANTIFVAPTRARTAGDFPRVAKVTWRKHLNGLGMSPVDVASVIVALAKAPGLGPHPHSLPAPVYWADGIAGASDTDLRFRGNAPVQVN